MKKIGILSDTHGYFNEKLIEFFSNCDEIWHAGDIGNIETADKIAKIKPLRAVHGNIDGHEVRIVHPQYLRFKIEDVDVLITHIGGYPGNYDRTIRDQLKSNPPKLFVCGHSHILKIMYDKKLDLLHINPGAAGKSGFHKVSTAVRFCIDKNNFKEMEILEMEK
jgi:putative phosphoesterase